MTQKIKDLFEKYTEWADHLLLILSVFICTFFAYRDFGLRMIFGYLLLAGILGIHLLRRSYLKRPIKVGAWKTAYFLIAAAILVFFLMIGARRDEDTVAYMISMLVCAGYLFCAEPSEREIKNCGKVFWAAGSLFALAIVFFRIFPDLYWKTVYQIISEPCRELAAYYIPKGYGIPIGGSYTFADYVMTLGALFSFGHLCSREESKKNKLLHLGFCALFFAAILLVGRRGEFIAAVAALVIVWLTFNRIKLTRRGWLLTGGIAVALIAAVILLWPTFEKIPFLYRYIRTFEKLLSGADITSGRTELWSMAWMLFLKNPVLGLGWGGFASHVSEAFRAVHGQDVMDVHNTYLQLLCETGIVGTVLILTPILFCLVQTIRQTRRLRRAEADRTALIAMNTVSLGLQVFFLALGMLDPCFYKLIYWAFYAVALVLFATALRLEGIELPGYFGRWLRWRKGTDKK